MSECFYYPIPKNTVVDMCASDVSLNWADYSTLISLCMHCRLYPKEYMQWLCRGRS